MPRRDVAIYAPASSGLLAEPPVSDSGGAELQMTLLARHLARSGLSVCQVVYPRADLPQERDGVAIVARAAPRVGGRWGAIREMGAIATALKEADARVVVHRSAGADVAVTAVWCRLARRRFVFSSSSTADFTLTTLRHRPRDVAAYKLGLRLARTVVVQTNEQRLLARGVLGARVPVVTIRSIARTLDPAGTGRCFLWAGGASSYKDPGSYVRLACALPEARFMMILASRETSEHGIDTSALLEKAKGIPNLDIRGAMQREQLLDEIRHAVAVVNTSEFEGMPNAFLEAWARGVPALSLRVDPDSVINTAGLGVAAGGSWERFVSGARELWRSRGASDEQRRRIQAYLREHHDPEVTVAPWIDLIH